jgi:hypothetical protein
LERKGSAVLTMQTAYRNRGSWSAVLCICEGISKWNWI